MLNVKRRTRYVLFPAIDNYFTVLLILGRSKENEILPDMTTIWDGLDVCGSLRKMGFIYFI